ncbi:hypothetical protein ACFYUV_38050 [Nonomuraea sp. NPDC003560]|uniref:hypothetical protein n=1 Tax=Nonomuraea sp. NPDC003560 TaxID=3364341 RepID=UPI0036A9A40F
MSHPVYDEPVTRHPRRSGGRDRTIALVAVLVAVVATLVAVALAVVLITRPASQGTAAAAATTTAATGSSPAAATPSPTRKPAQPRTEAAVRTAAEQSFDAYAAGAYGEFWDMWTSQTKQVVSRKDYVRRFKLCPSAAEGLRWQIQAVTLAGARARVRAARSILVQTYTFAYQGGRWRFQPSAEMLQPYQTKTVDQIVREERAAGRCA